MASTLFALLAMGLTATFIQNIRMAKTLGYRTQAVNTASSVAEQIRGVGYSDILDYYYKASSPASFAIKLIDPTATAATPSFYRTFTLPLNIVTIGSPLADQTITSTWTETDVAFDPSPSAPKIPMRFWLTLKLDESLTSGSVRQVFQVGLIYQWRNPAVKNAQWQGNTIRLALPNASAAKI